jgi:type IV secretory pathway TrbD component
MLREDKPTVGDNPRETGDRRHDVTFKVTDRAKVGGQFGVVNGNVHIYDVGPAATPAERFAKALNLLNGNMPRRAEELIREAVEAGHRSHEVSYFWALAILSGRSFDHLGPEEFTSLQDCASLVDPANQDGWLEALHVITQFINCLVRQERLGDLPDQEFDQVIWAYDRLEDKRREEIRRHLDLIMTGALQDRLEFKYAAEVKQRRMADNRAERAWKFFQPVPCPPIVVHLREPRLDTAHRTMAIIGAAVSGAALLVAFCVLLPNRPLLALLFAVGMGGGGYLLVTSGRSWLVRRERIAADAVRHDERTVPSRYTLYRPRPDVGDDEGYVWGESDKDDEEHRRELRNLELFRLLAGPWVDVRFADEDPDGANKRKKWEADTAGLRRALTAHIQRQYARPDRWFIGEVDWLICWHAKRAKKRWEDGTLRAHRDELRASGLVPGLGIIALLTGLLCGIVGLLTWNPGFGVVLLLVAGAGGWAVYGSKVDVYAVQRDFYLAESALAAAEQDEEKAAFDRWTKRLEDRPTDDEMARWLDYDKFYIKNLAMNTCGLANRDIVTHAILTEDVWPCMRARVLFGPPRYSIYRIIVFLLTEAGVRQVSVNLDFLDGTVRDLRRNSFRYDAISSSRVEEVGIQFDSGHRSVVPIDGRAEDKSPPKDVNSLILSQAFRLSFMDGKHIDVVVENYDHGFLDRLREDGDSLFELALDSSGVRDAWRVLDSVAAEGREWLHEERRRRNRRLLDFSKALASRNELPWHTSHPPPLELENRPPEDETGWQGPPEVS